MKYIDVEFITDLPVFEEPFKLNGKLYQSSKIVGIKAGNRKVFTAIPESAMNDPLAYIKNEPEFKLLNVRSIKIL